MADMTRDEGFAKLYRDAWVAADMEGYEDAGAVRRCLVAVLSATPEVLAAAMGGEVLHNAVASEIFPATLKVIVLPPREVDGEGD